MPQFLLRKGQAADEEWLFQLFRKTMQDYIDQAWGWEELLQREGFVTTLPAREFQILAVEGSPVGCYHLGEKPDHLLLNMIMVEPRWQGRGFGRLMMERVQQTGIRSGKPVRLRVLQTNPAVDFYRRFDFRQVGRDRHSLELSWQVEPQTLPDPSANSPK